MIVMVETVCPEVRYIDIWPAVVVVVSYRDSIAPSVIGHARFDRDIREGAVMIVVEERSVRRLGFSLQRLAGRAIHEVNIQPAIVVVVQQGHAGTCRVQNVLLLR